MKKDYVLVGGIAVLLTIVLAVLIPLLYSSAQLESRVQDAHDRAFTWLIANFTPQTGLFTYAVNPQTGEFPLENNAIRQLMASRAIAEKSSESSDLLELHTTNLTYLLDNWYVTEGERGYVLFEEKSKLGANAMLLRTLVASPLFENHAREARALALGIMSLQNADGSFEPWYVEPSYEYDKDYLLTFYSGEALLALVEYYQKTEQQEFLDAATRSANFYVQHYADNLAQNYYPAYVPWHSIALNKLYKLTGDTRYSNAAFTMTDKLLELQDTTTIRGRFYNPETPEFGRPHAASDAIYTEGLAYALELARLAGDKDRARTYEKAMWLGVQNLLSLQFKEERSDFPLPAYTYVGGLKTNVIDATIRVDNTQHALDAFVKILSLNP